MKTYTDADVVEALRERLKSQSQEEVAEEFGISRQYISLVLLGKQPPGPSIWGPLGFDCLPRTFSRS